MGRKLSQPTGLSGEKKSVSALGIPKSPIVNTSTYLCCVCIEKRMRAHGSAQPRSRSWRLWQWVTWPSVFLKMKQDEASLTQSLLPAVPPYGWSLSLSGLPLPAWAQMS